MCGISGYQGAFARDLLFEMNGCIAHRGPDAHGTVYLKGRDEACTGLAHRRLSIIDLSASANQPMSVRCERCGAFDSTELSLVFNGEIYNYRDLRRQLVASGHTFSSNSDSEVLLHLYAENGLALAESLNGIFAFALYDGRSKNRPNGVESGDLLILRDQLGVKPLYFANVTAGFLFSSELKALTVYHGLKREVDPVALHQYLAYLWTPAPRTMLRGVSKLEPGHALLVRDGKIAKKWQYYELPYGRSLRTTFDESAVGLAEAIERAVRRQLVSDVPIGAFLSGGLDSSAVVAMARRAEPQQPIPCYTISFTDGVQLDGSQPDLPYARQVANHVGVELRSIEINPTTMIQRLDQMLYALDEPQADPAPINAMLIAERARDDGIKVLLSGAGGDDIFSGYRRHAAIRSEQIWAKLPRPARSIVAMTARSAGRSRFLSNAPWRRRLVKMLEHADYGAERRTVAYFWWSGESLRRSLYSPQLADAVGSEDTAAPLLESLSRISSEHDPLNRMLYLETKHFLADHNLNYTDKTAMASGVEVRVPLLDIELVEFAARIPSALKQKASVGKYLFRKAMEPYLPREVIYRKKTGFGAPLRYWLRNDLKDRVDDTLSISSITKRGFFSAEAVHRLIALDRAGRVDGAYTVFALMCFEIWCRLFIDGQRI